MNQLSPAELFNKTASLYQDKFMYLDLYNDTYDRFCALIEKQHPRIFEIACGPGNITKYLLTKRPDFHIEATDIAPNMIELAKQNNPTAHFSVMDCRDISSLDKTFDGIVCGFCMPYLSKEECVKLITDFAGLLNSDGIFYFSVIEGNYQDSGYVTGSNSEDAVYLYYHEEGYLSAALKANGLELVTLARKPYEDTSIHLVFIARKAA